MMDYSISDLMQWNKRIEDIIDHEGLSCYPQEFEICSYEDMLCYEAYVGMPSHYPHWSFGKVYEKQKTLYQYDLTGLPYEMVINSNPSIAYLMKDNSLLLQILTMAHVYGHNDFFKNNRLFVEGTNADTTIEMFKNHAGRIRAYIGDPTIGYFRVERILDAAHAIKYHTSRTVGVKKLSDEDIKKRLLDQYYEKIKRTSVLDEKKDLPFPDINKIPLEPTEDLMGILTEYGLLEEWEKDINNNIELKENYINAHLEEKNERNSLLKDEPEWVKKRLENIGIGGIVNFESIKCLHLQLASFLGGTKNPIGKRVWDNIEKKECENCICCIL